MFIDANDFSYYSSDHEDDFFNVTSDFTTELNSDFINTEILQEVASPQMQHLNPVFSQLEPKTGEPMSPPEINKSEDLSRDLSSRSSTRAPKRKVNLSYRADDFKKLFYQTFTTKKRFHKSIIKKIHDIILIPLQLRKMAREEYRRIDLYFQNFARFGAQILIYLHNNKEDLLDAIPELSELK